MDQATLNLRTTKSIAAGKTRMEKAVDDFSKKSRRSARAGERTLLDAFAWTITGRRCGESAG